MKSNFDVIYNESTGKKYFNLINDKIVNDPFTKNLQSKPIPSSAQIKADNGNVTAAPPSSSPANVTDAGFFSNLSTGWKIGIAAGALAILSGIGYLVFHKKHAAS